MITMIIILIIIMAKWEQHGPPLALLTPFIFTIIIIIIIITMIIKIIIMIIITMIIKIIIIIILIIITARWEQHGPPTGATHTLTLSMVSDPLVQAYRLARYFLDIFLAIF